MKMIKKINLRIWLLFFSMLSVVTFAQEGAEAAGEGTAEAVTAAAQVVVEQPIYERMGLTSNQLFYLMMFVTIILVACLMMMGYAFRSMVDKFTDDINKGAKLILLAVFLGYGSTAMAAEPFVQGEFNIPMPDWVVITWLSIDATIALVILFMWANMKKLIPEYAKPKSWFRWKQIQADLTDAVAIENEASITFDHEYDGIRELDNNLPPWWKYGFYITIAWAFGYVLYYQVFEVGALQEREFQEQWEAGEVAVAEYKKAHPELITAENVVQLDDPSSLAQGKAVYDQFCASCHMEGGAGGIGPNLTDDYWLYDNGIKGVFESVYDGRSNGMVAWKELMPADKIQFVASYVLSLEYIAPPNGKDPQGELKEE